MCFFLSFIIPVFDTDSICRILATLFFFTKHSLNTYLLIIKNAYQIILIQSGLSFWRSISENHLIRGNNTNFWLRWR